MTSALPRWADLTLVPLANLFLAFIALMLVILAIGQDPLAAVGILVQGAVGSGSSIGYTLFYATNFIFTALAVALAFHAGLFNIGGEGQAYFGGLGMTFAALAVGAHVPGVVAIPIAMLGAMAFGAFWAFVPAVLQAWRGSHIVITTIMFNFIAAGLVQYIIVDHLRPQGLMALESPDFAETLHLPQLRTLLEPLGIDLGRSPVNLALPWAIACCVFFWLLVWRTRWGYAIRTVGYSAKAAQYAGISNKKVIVGVMLLSGALASFVAMNELLGIHHRMLLNYSAGYGFAGIAVALMGRNHPFGIFLAALLFGALYQGGGELSFEMPQISREMVVAIQGLVILFSGALAPMTRPWVARLLVAGKLTRPAQA